MMNKSLVTAANSSERTIADDSERTIVTPHFDAAARRGARRAVPLSNLRHKISPQTLLIVFAVVGGLVGGLVGGVLAMNYFRHDAAPAVAQSNSSGGTTAQAAESSAPIPPPTQTAEQLSARAESDGRTTLAETDDRTRAGSTEADGADNAASAGRDDAAANERPEDAQAALRGALDDWIAATNKRDIGKQLSFYGPKMSAFYRSRNTSLSDVRGEKERAFARADAVDVRAGNPDIKLGPDGQTATMLFRKRYQITGGGEDRRGEVLQELRWRRVGGKWKIVSERDVRVLH